MYDLSRFGLKRWVVVTLALYSAVVFGQNSQSSIITRSVSKPPVSLDEAARSYLDYATVRVEVKVDPSQDQKATYQQARKVIRFAFGVLRAYIKAENDREKTPVSLSYQFSTNYELAWSDLYPAQKRRLREIALQDNPLSCLQTNDLQFALALDSKQIQKLKSIYERESAKSLKKIEPAMNKLDTRVKQLMETFSKKFDSSSSEERVDLAESMMNQLVTVMAEYTPAFSKGSNYSSGEVLQVLDPGQRKRLKELQGKPFLWKARI